MKDNGSMDNQKERELILRHKERYMKDNGRMAIMKEREF